MHRWPWRPPLWWIAAITLSLLPLAAGCGGADSPSRPAPPTYELIAPQAAYDLMLASPDLQVIDTSETYFEHRIPRAVSYRVRDGYFDQALAQLDKGAAYLVYGFLGEQSQASAQQMIDAGFREVHALEGGIIAWLDANLPVESSFG